MTTDTPISCHDHGNCELCDQIERDLRECVELLAAWRATADVAMDLNFVIVAKRTDALLARLKETP